MEISNGTVGVLAACCLTAGAGGAYLATRSSERPPSATGSAEPAASQAPPAPVAEKSEPVRTPRPSPVASGLPAAPRPARPRPAPPRPTVSREAEAPITSVPPESAAELETLPVPAVSLEAQSVALPVLAPMRPPGPEPTRTVEPPSAKFEELVVSTDSVVGLQMQTSVNSEGAHVEDEVVARVTRDVRVGDRVVIPAGAEAWGEVTLVERGGRLRDRARLGVRFTLVVLADGTRIPLETETIYRDGDAPGRESAARIGGGALGGAVIGGFLAGAKGAAIDGSVGAGVGTTAAFAGGRGPAALPRGTPVTVRLTAPTVVIVEKE